MITAAIDAYIASLRHEHKPSDSIYATDLGSCLRKVTMRRAGFESSPFNARTMRIFKVGDMYHTFITDALAGQKVLIAQEVVGKKDNISLRADAIVKSDKGNILIEIKSVNSNKFTYIKPDSDPHYLMQTAINYYVLKDEYKLVGARLYYVSKDDLRTTELDVPLEKWVPRALTYVIDLNAAWDVWKKEGKLPPKLDDVKNRRGVVGRPWRCNYCNFKASCNKHIDK